MKKIIFYSLILIISILVKNYFDVLNEPVEYRWVKNTVIDEYMWINMNEWEEIILEK